MYHSLRFYPQQLVALLAVFLILPARPVLGEQDAGAVPATIRINIKEGEGALNNIRTLRAKEPVVLVTDAAGRPIPGVQVTFILPDFGASGVFPSGSTLTVATGPDGIAVGRGLKPNNVIGTFEIRVAASYQGQTNRLVISQTNAASQKSGGSGTKTAILLAVLGGAGAAVAVGVTRGGKSTSAANPSTSISAGGSSFGPPK